MVPKDKEERYHIFAFTDEGVYGRWAWWYRFWHKFLLGYEFVKYKDLRPEERVSLGLPPKPAASPEPDATSSTDVNP